MRQFEQMWRNIGQRSTDLIYRMEQLPEDFVRSSFPEGTAVHKQAESVGEMAREQQEAIDGMQQNAEKVETIRNRGEKVGRNDPCPCGSGKKYKQCCMKKA
jgi:preprotein translocase subunit SecA